MNWAQQERLATMVRPVQENQNVTPLSVPEWDVPSIKTEGNARSSSAHIIPTAAVRNNGTAFAQPEERVNLCHGRACSIYVQRRVLTVVVAVFASLIVFLVMSSGAIVAHKVAGQSQRPSGNTDSFPGSSLLQDDQKLQLHTWLASSSCSPDCLDQTWCVDPALAHKKYRFSEQYVVG